MSALAAAWAWIAGSKVGRYVAAAGALVAAVLFILAKAKRDGAREALSDMKEKDRDRSNEIEDRADEALRRRDGDTRDVRDRMRDDGRLRDD